MKKSLLAVLTLTLLGNVFALEYKETRDWVRLPDVNCKPTNQHGDVTISSKGEIYVSTLDPSAGVQVFHPEGKFLRNVPGAPNDFHGFVIRKDGDGEFIYGPRLEQQSIVNLTLDGQ